jgi:hypothetical protein
MTRAKLQIISINTKYFYMFFCEFPIKSFAYSLFILCYGSALPLLFLCFCSRKIAFAEWWNNVFFAKVQCEKVKFHTDIRKRQVDIL